MTEGAVEPAPNQPRPASARGRLEVRPRVVEKVATQTARSVPGVLTSRAGPLGTLAGRDLPRVSVQVKGNRTTVGLDLALAWPLPAAVVAGEVRRRVAAEITRLTSLTVGRVDVDVVKLIAAVGPEVADPESQAKGLRKEGE